jgi:hypothetical protein
MQVTWVLTYQCALQLYVPVKETTALSDDSSPTNIYPSPMHRNSNAEPFGVDFAQQLAAASTVIHATAGNPLPVQLQQQQSFLSNSGEDDYSWLFRESSLFDLPPDDYLTLHFGGGLGATPPVSL